MIALWAFKVEVGFASTLLGAMVFLMSLTYFTNHSDQDGCTGPTISRLFFWVSSPWVVLHNSSTFIYSSEMQPMVYINQPMVYMFIYQPIEICNVFICSYQSPPPQDPQGPTEFKHAEPSPRISADIPMKSSVRPSPFFAPHPACNEHPDWGRSHGVGFSFHWLEILNPRGLVVVVVHGCFSHGFAAPLAISCNINIMLICWKLQKLETNSSPKPDCRARS
jgi:hypothetical protein